ncbi:hypothetical protein KHA80_14375 [Anaerobacillus sp. HL2]|nr:hypothetical protein KHA80_14375 [Anaerobacillus sp. HL2]
MKTGGGGPIPGAFVATMKSGHIGVFRRKGKESTPITGTLWSFSTTDDR